jgi:hypothetical protein
LSAALEPYVNAVALRRAWKEFDAEKDWEAVHTAYVLALWLDQTARPQVVNDQGVG